jgi:hypothetical protein
LNNYDNSYVTPYMEEDLDIIWLQLNEDNNTLEIYLLDENEVWQTKNIATKWEEFQIIDSSEVSFYEGNWWETTEFIYEEIDRIQQSYGKSITWISWSDSPIWGDNSTSDRAINNEKDRYESLINQTEYLGDIIKILPSDFVTNDDSDKPIVYEDDLVNKGIKIGRNSQELYWFVKIPRWMKATHVKIYWNSTDSVNVYESDISDWTWSESLWSATMWTEISITETVNTQRNFLVIQINVGSTWDLLYGWYVKVQSI